VYQSVGLELGRRGFWAAALAVTVTQVMVKLLHSV
jgi:CheY-like chemotaxis protein